MKVKFFSGDDDVLIVHDKSYSDSFFGLGTIRVDDDVSLWTIWSEILPRDCDPVGQM